MKKVSLITVFAAMLLLVAGVPALAQEKSGEDQSLIGYTRFDVEESFADNGFQWFRDAQLLCAGNREKSNAMTIGWGGHRYSLEKDSADGLCCRDTLYQRVFGQLRVFHRDVF